MGRCFVPCRPPSSVPQGTESTHHQQVALMQSTLQWHDAGKGWGLIVVDADRQLLITWIQCCVESVASSGHILIILDVMHSSMFN